MGLLKLEDSNSFGNFKVNKNYRRSQGSSNEIIYTFYGIIPLENVDKTLIEQVSEVKYKYCNVGFQTLFIFNDVSNELSSRLLLKDLSDNFDKLCLNENDEFMFNLK